MNYFIITGPEHDRRVRSFKTLREARAAYDGYITNGVHAVLTTSIDPPAPPPRNEFTVILSKMVGCFVPKTRYTVCKTISLPFAPALRMVFGEQVFVVDRVAWSNERFYCECDNVQPIVDDLDKLDTLIESMKRDGWKLA